MLRVQSPCKNARFTSTSISFLLVLFFLPLDTLSESRYLVADKGGVPAYRIFTFVASREPLGNQSASDFVALFHKDPSCSHDISLRALTGFFAGYAVPYMHLGHESHLFAAPLADLGRVQWFSSGAIPGLSG